MAESAPAQPAAANTTPPNNGTKWKKPKKKPQDVTLYELMEVNWDASPDEIKKAYRKRALKLHPDKGGDPAKFHAMKRAYDVLSDDKKRAAYDKYGPEMLKVMEGEASPDVLIMLLLKQRRYRALILAIAIIVVGFLVLFPVLQAVRWDGASWSWAIVFIPLWLVLVIVFLAQLQILYRGPSSGEGEEPSAKRAPPAPSDVLTLVLLFSGAVIFLAFLSARLDATITWNWYTVIIPWLVFEITLCVHRFLGARQAVAHMKLQLQAIREYQVKTIDEAKADLEGGDLDAAIRIHEAEEAIKACDEEMKILGMSKSYLFSAFFWPVLRFTTAFLIAARANGDFTGTWFLTAIPFMFGTAVFPVLEGIRARDDPENADAAGRTCCVGFIQYSIALLIWLLGMAKMDNHGIYSAFAVWGPYFVLAGFLFCNMTLILCVNPDDMMAQQQQQNGGGTAAGADATGAEAANGEPVVQVPPAEAEKKPEEVPNVIILT